MKPVKFVAVIQAEDFSRRTVEFSVNVRGNNPWAVAEFLPQIKQDDRILAVFEESFWKSMANKQELPAHPQFVQVTN